MKNAYLFYFYRRSTNISLGKKKKKKKTRPRKYCGLTSTRNTHEFYVEKTMVKCRA